MGFAMPAFAVPYAFPVPFVEKQHSFIYFKDLPGPGKIRIFTVAGEEVVNLPIASGESLKKWDVLNESGKRLATGVYLYIIESGSEETKGKLVVIR